MAVRVARTASGALRALAAASLCCLTALPGSAAAQVAEAPPPPPPQLSRLCEAPSADITSAAPLPRTVEKLRKGGELRVLAIGTSAVGGAGSPPKNYQAQVEAILEQAFKGLNVVMVNRGVSGEVAALTAERIKLQVALEKPDVVLWQVGTNDALARVSAEDFERSVRETVQWLKEHRVDVILVGLQYSPKLAADENYAAIRGALRQVAASENVPLVRRYAAMEFLERGRKGEIAPIDTTDLNDLGYRCMAEHIARAMVVSAFPKAVLSPGPKPAAPE
ncbi:SGNH/GDSL hydrolase family protein [Enterovirga aerilata]|uniref:SGNH/GDSL hydrolase family protein n=1 Tax=Enterovirga aerilata TaxID=2730920 RepID=A0A849I493_9HYPH|nr:SGNH/GDSL hydrolase family protein [Enterovirga sp. DB1703]NNM72178.1 SGNH/GDSL hydrolase family protein [Enterovirga sp. DB1703]